MIYAHMRPTDVTDPDPTPADPGGTYTLRRPHWHGGTLHPPGTVLTGLYPDQIERIQAAEEAPATEDVNNG